MIGDGKRLHLRIKKGSRLHVVAKGYGELAERIMAEAQRQGIYVHDAPELVALLMQLDLDAEIPASLYQVVAELLVWVFELSENGISHRETLK
ncbi:hypothetical protein HAALTHF_07630n [Vreelandella aquamarina]|nr:hypothetical protein HAALTHF_07630n [Halomonas axialensis]